MVKAIGKLHRDVQKRISGSPAIAEAVQAFARLPDRYNIQNLREVMSRPDASIRWAVRVAGATGSIAPIQKPLCSPLAESPEMNRF